MTGLWVFLGGGFGALARWGISLSLSSPWGTFVANVGGSFLLALLMASPLGATAWRFALGVGLLGGFTTYSTFNLELLQAIQRGNAWVALGYAPLTLASCFGASLLGWWIGSLFGGAASPTG